MTPEARVAQPAPLAVPRVPVQLPDLSLRADGLTEHYRRLEEIVSREIDDMAPNSALVIPGLVDPGVASSLDLGDDGEDLLEDARANIADGNHSLALAQLTEFLEMTPGHPEARYLQAYCHYQLGGPGHMEALRILLPLRDEQVTSELRTSVKELRAELRRVVVLGEGRRFLNTLAADPRTAVDRLARFVELLPEDTVLPYLLAWTQERLGDVETGLRIARAAIRSAEGDTSDLRRLADQLETRRARELAADGLAELRRGDYAQARHALRLLPPEWRGTQLLRDLDDFVGMLHATGHPKITPFPAPRVTTQRAERLYSLIAEEDGQAAVALLNAERYAEAERLLAPALHVVPGFPWLNLLYAYSLCAQGRRPDRAIAAAEIAVRDRSLVEAPRILAEARAMREVLTISEVVQEYNTALDVVTGPLTPEKLTTVERSMEQIEARLPELRSIATPGVGAEVVRDLATAVGMRMAEIAEARHSMAVGDLAERLIRVGARVRGHQLSTADRRELAEITRHAQRLLSTVKDNEVRQVLRQILAGADQLSAMGGRL